MTNTELDEIDHLVGTLVMGWDSDKQMEDCEMFVYSPGCRRTFCPTRNLFNAWEVVEHLSKKCIHLDIISVDDGFMVGNGSGMFVSDVGIIDGHLEGFAVAETAPLAICLAALKAVGC